MSRVFHSDIIQRVFDQTAEVIRTTIASISAGENHIGQVGASSVRPTDNFTRPNDTTTYAAGEVMSDSDSAPTAAYLTFSACARNNGGGGWLNDVRLIDSANQSSLPAAFELWLFHTAVTIDNDNSAFTPTDAECATFVGVIPLTTSFQGTSTAGANGNRVYAADKSNLPIHFTCAAADTALYGVLVVRNAFVPIASENFTIELEISQD